MCSAVFLSLTSCAFIHPVISPSSELTLNFPFFYLLCSHIHPLPLQNTFYTKVGKKSAGKAKYKHFTFCVHTLTHSSPLDTRKSLWVCECSWSESFLLCYDFNWLRGRMNLVHSPRCLSSSKDSNIVRGQTLTLEVPQSEPSPVSAKTFQPFSEFRKTNLQ